MTTTTISAKTRFAAIASPSSGERRRATLILFVTMQCRKIANDQRL